MIIKQQNHLKEWKDCAGWDESMQQHSDASNVMEQSKKGTVYLETAVQESALKKELEKRKYDMKGLALLLFDQHPSSWQEVKKLLEMEDSNKKKILQFQHYLGARSDGKFGPESFKMLRKKRKELGCYSQEQHFYDDADGLLSSKMKDRVYGRASYTDEKLRVDKKPTVDDVESVIKSSLKKGSKGEKVRIMQQMLITCGYDIGNTGVDGLFGPKTLAAVKKFQSKHNILSGSGSVDQQTWDALKKLYYKRLKNTSKKKEITKDVSTYVKKQAGLINP